MNIYLVSACLLGHQCRYDGECSKVALPPAAAGEQWIPVCPECLGELPIPRPPAEIMDGDGDSVLAGTARIIDRTGKDRTEAFVTGAQKVLAIACSHEVVGAILKARSPSCGKGQIYDGTFSGALRNGHGVTAALLRQNGFSVWTEEEWLERMNSR